MSIQTKSHWGVNMERVVVAVVLMALSAFAGLFLGAVLGNTLGGMILCVLISGIACIIYSLNNKN